MVAGSNQRFRAPRVHLVAVGVVVVAPGCSRSKLHILESRAAAGDLEAMCELGAAYESLSGDGIVPHGDMRKSLFYYRQAAEKGHTPAMYALSGLLTERIPIEEKTLWLKKGAELGDLPCMIRLRDGYERGIYGLPKDSSQANAWQIKIRMKSEDQLRKQGYLIR